jgi:membrane protein implicated in regulation of membrane protease activity
MFKALKYLFLANVYNKAKKSFLTLLISIVLLIVFSFMINDAMSLATGMSIYILLMVKWVSILSLLSLIGYSILKIVNIATAPLSMKKSRQTNSEEVIDNKKDRILNKEKLYTKSDLILKKYMKDQ